MLGTLDVEQGDDVYSELHDHLIFAVAAGAEAARSLPDLARVILGSLSNYGATVVRLIVKGWSSGTLGFDLDNGAVTELVCSDLQIGELLEPEGLVSHVLSDGVNELGFLMFDDALAAGYPLEVVSDFAIAAIQRLFAHERLSLAHASLREHRDMLVGLQADIEIAQEISGTTTFRWNYVTGIDWWSKPVCAHGV